MGTVSITIEGQTSFLTQVSNRLKDYWSLIKSLQTGLLVLTAVAGYISGCCLSFRAGSIGGLIGSLFLAVSGSTVLNMAIDRDIDAKMLRTARRPLPAGRLSPGEGWALGLLLSSSGLVWAALLDPVYAGVVAAGLFMDVAVYTVWLKRRTPFSILIGGLSGGMPALAGRVLATGRIDEVGLLLALGILLWIPTHIMTLTIKYQSDYSHAAVPTFPSAFGVPVTRLVIGVSTLLAVLVLYGAQKMISLPPDLLQISSLTGLALLGLTVFSLVRPGKGINFVLYKGASVYMLLTMILMIIGGI